MVFCEAGGEDGGVGWRDGGGRFVGEGVFAFLRCFFEDERLDTSI